LQTNLCGGKESEVYKRQMLQERLIRLHIA
jgi:hypothetical protein